MTKDNCKWDVDHHNCKIANNHANCQHASSSECKKLSKNITDEQIVVAATAEKWGQRLSKHVSLLKLLWRLKVIVLTLNKEEWDEIICNAAADAVFKIQQPVLVWWPREMRVRHSPRELVLNFSFVKIFIPCSACASWIMNISSKSHTHHYISNKDSLSCWGHLWARQGRNVIDARTLSMLWFQNQFSIGTPLLLLQSLDAKVSAMLRTSINTEFWCVQSVFNQHTTIKTAAAWCLSKHNYWELQHWHIP